MSDMRDVILKQGDQIRRSLEVNKDVRVEGTFDAMVMSCIGGSGHPGDLLNALHLPRVPLLVHRGYDLPHLLNRKPLVIASSYSGNTEEPLSGYVTAQREGYTILANTSGGRLLEWSERDGTPVVKIDFPGMQPRHTLLASFVGLATALKNSGLAEDCSDDLQRVADVLDTAIPAMEAEAKALAERVKGKTPVFSASLPLAFAAKNFKIQTNENAKAPAFWSDFPELNHNEMVGFSHPTGAPGRFIAVMLRDDQDHPRIKARMDVTAELYTAWGLDVAAVQLKGMTLLEKLFYAAAFGMWTTYYLAQEYDIDPVPVEGVENFKKRLVEVAGEAV